MLTPEGYPKGRAGTEVPLELSRRRGTVANVVRTGWSGKPCADGGKGRRRVHWEPAPHSMHDGVDRQMHRGRLAPCTGYRSGGIGPPVAANVGSRNFRR